MASNSPAVITAPTCRFKTKRKGAHIGIVRADICGDCLADMQASLVGKAPVFCHECGHNPDPGELMAYFYRDTGAMWLCQTHSNQFAAKITSELDAAQAAKDALRIQSINAREQIVQAATPEEKLRLWEYWRRVVGPRRKA